MIRGLVLGPPLGQEDPDHGVLVQGVGPQAVYGFRWDAYQAPPGAEWAAASCMAAGSDSG